jgi:hypothetical protein
MTQLDRKDFLKLTITIVGTAAFAEACGGEEPTPTPGTGGTAGSGGASAGTAGAGTSSGGTAGTPSGGTAGTPSGGTAGTPSGGTAGTPSGGTAGTPSGGTAGGGQGGTAGASGGAGAGGAGSGGAAGSGGSGGSGGAAGGAGKAGGGGTAGGGGMMCGMFGATQTAQTGGTPHMHTVMMEMTVRGQITAGMATTVTVMGGHTHTFMITAAEAMMLRSGGMVTGKISSMDNMHTHTYTLQCT